MLFGFTYAIYLNFIIQILMFYFINVQDVEAPVHKDIRLSGTKLHDTLYA
jgi:hypothetical protein